MPSKWETVDPEEVQAQAVTSKWDLFDNEGNDNNGGKANRRRGLTDPDDEDDDDVDGENNVKKDLVASIY